MKKAITSILLLCLYLNMIGQSTVVDVVVDSPIHETLETAVLAANLAGTLSGEGPFTVFAPTDDAFAMLPDGALDELLADPNGALTDVLLYHVAAGEVLSTDLADGQTYETVLGPNISVGISNGAVFINDSEVTVANLQASNGVVHVIDAVLSVPPPSTVVDIIVESDVHNTLEAAVLAADLAGTLSGDGPFTVFAPTDAAFDELPEGTLETLLEEPGGLLTDILLYHAAPGLVLAETLEDGQTYPTAFGPDINVSIDNGMVFINDAMVIVTDLEADNGVVHVIDAVLLPPPSGTNTVVDIIVNSDAHNTLEAAVIAADLAGTLSGDGPFTIFAPTDDAFDALPDGALDELLDDPEALAFLLTYHALGAQVLSTDLSNGQAAATLQGADVNISFNGDNVFVNQAQVTVVDLIGDNGVVHVIDAILIPPFEDDTVWDVIDGSDDHNTLAAAVEAAELVGTLDGEGTFTVFAPTDAAFDLIPEETLNALLAEPSGDLTDILLYHVLGTKVWSTALSDGLEVNTVEGSSILFNVDANGVTINETAMVNIANISVSNGIVHVIDAVLLPGESSGLETLESNALNVYPIPASNNLTIQISEQDRTSEWIAKVYNSLGQEMSSNRFSGTNFQLDISELAPASYILQLRNENYQINRNILVK